MSVRFLLATFAILLCWIMVATAAGDVIELRDGKRLTDVSTVSVNEDGVLLAGGEIISLDRIRKATVGPQDTFDRLHQTISLDLFRLRIRIEKADYENLQPHLDKLYPVFESRSSESAIIVHLASLHHERISGHWELALRSHFRLMALAAKSERNSRFLDSMNYRYDKKSGLAGNLCPFGIPEERIAAAWESILAAYRSLPKQHPHGLDFYFFQLADAASIEVDPEVSSNRLQLTSLEKMLLATLNKAVDAKDAQTIEKARLSFMEHKFQDEDSDVHRALYLLVGGMLDAKGETGDRNNGLLQLLRIHAGFGPRTSAISAAGLYQVVQILKANGSLNDAKKVAHELKSRYPSSIFAKQLKMKKTE